MQEDFEAALQWADEKTSPARRRAWQDYLRSVSWGRAEARPELDLTDRPLCEHVAWRYELATWRAALAITTTGRAEPVDLDNELLLAKMMQSMAVGW